MKRQTPLKDAYDSAYVERLAGAVEQVCGELRAEDLIARIFAEGWDELELKGRMSRIAQALDQALPPDFEHALQCLDPVVSGFSGYHAMFFPAFVELRVARDFASHWELAVSALARYTKHSSSEFAVRPMLIADQERMLGEMLAWTSSDDEHLRRLASEGCRPRLPWAMALPALKLDPTPLLPLLEALRDDASEYVRRSVANNLNDISKDHPELVLDLARRWQAERPDNIERSRLVKHACRTLLKAGDPKAMRLFGFRDPADIEVVSLALGSQHVALGGELEFSLGLVGVPALGRIRLEYAVHYRKANGRLSPKVFKISEFESADAERQISRRHSFRELSTRRHHAGRHELAVIVNGVEKARAEFFLGD